MQKKAKLVLLSFKMVILGFIIDAVNHFMLKMNEKRGFRAYKAFYLADKILENRRIQFFSAEQYYLNLYAVAA